MSSAERCPYQFYPIILDRHILFPVSLNTMALPLPPSFACKSCLDGASHLHLASYCRRKYRHQMPHPSSQAAGKRRRAPTNDWSRAENLCVLRHSTVQCGVHTPVRSSQFRCSELKKRTGSILLNHMSGQEARDAALERTSPRTVGWGSLEDSRRSNRKMRTVCS